MATIWVIESGEYSDYRVNGVFSSRENAQAIADWINSEHDGYIEAKIAEWPLDPAVDQLRTGLKQFIVNMLYDGTVERCEQRDLRHELGDTSRVWERTKAGFYKGKGIPDCLDCTVWAKDEQHAIKIVNERRTQMIANGEWPAQ